MPKLCSSFEGRHYRAMPRNVRIFADLHRGKSMAPHDRSTGARKAQSRRNDCERFTNWHALRCQRAGVPARADDRDENYCKARSRPTVPAGIDTALQPMNADIARIDSPMAIALAQKPLRKSWNPGCRMSVSTRPTLTPNPSGAAMRRVPPAASNEMRTPPILPPTIRGPALRTAGRKPRASDWPEDTWPSGKTRKRDPKGKCWRGRP